MWLEAWSQLPAPCGFQGEVAIAARESSCG